MIIWLTHCGFSTSPKAFDPKDENQIVEIYVKTNFYKDYSVYEKYDLEGINGYYYTQKINSFSKDRRYWDHFSKKVEQYRLEIAPKYDKKEQKIP